MREGTKMEGALTTKHQEATKNKWKSKGNGTHAELAIGKGKKDGQKKSYPPYQHCNKKGHPSFKCWRRPDAKCSKCNQMGHEENINKDKRQQHYEEETNTTDQEEEDHLFVA